jgi:hypothetical protein
MEIGFPNLAGKKGNKEGWNPVSCASVLANLLDSPSWFWQTSAMSTQATPLSLNLDAETLRWLNQVAVASNRSVETVIADVLTLLASPESQEDELIDKLLASAVNYFPAIMELDEQEEMREEVIDYLCMRLIEVGSASKSSLTNEELAHLREKLVARSGAIWLAT